MTETPTIIMIDLLTAKGGPKEKASAILWSQELGIGRREGSEMER